MKNNILLSICIPTYNRGEILNQNLKQILEIKSQDIEFVISDNASSDNTKSILKQLKDPRIKYHRNEQNIGADANFVKSVELASGEFIFFISDKDIIEQDAIDFIIDIIKNNENISVMLGKVIFFENYKYGYEDKIWKKGHESLVEFFLSHGYMAGIILRKSSLDLNQAKRYIGCFRIHEFLMHFAMLKGDTLTSSKVFCHKAFQEKRLDRTKIENKEYKKTPLCLRIAPFLPSDNFFNLKIRIHFIYDITKDLPETRSILLNNLREYAATLLAETFFQSPYAFLGVFPYFFMTKECSKSLRFWKFLSHQLFIKVKIFLSSILAMFNLSRFPSPIPSNILFAGPIINKNELISKIKSYLSRLLFLRSPNILILTPETNKNDLVHRIRN